HDVPCWFLPGRGQVSQVQARHVQHGIRFDAFYELDDRLFQTDCTHSNSSGSFKCDGWYAADGQLKAGPYDPPNEWYPDDCSLGSYNCHNNLRASLRMQVELITSGYIRYKFTVSTEHKFDGLLFFLDSSPEPLMGLESNQFDPVQIMLEPGIHTLEWVYYKDSKFTKGRDSAALHLIEVGGIDYTDRQCFPCQAGFYSEEGSTECAPCPVDHYSREGWPECKPCSAEEYAQSPPRANCSARPPCNVTTDAAPTYGNCSAVDNQRIKTWAWLSPHICAPLSEDEDLPADTHEPCPPCPSGQYAVEDSTTRTRLCHFCPPGLARSASVSKTDKACRKCPPGEVAVKALTMDHFELHRVKLPDGFVTGCSGDCGSLGWRVVNGKLDSGSNHGKSASVWLSYDVSMAVDGHITFAYDDDPGADSAAPAGPTTSDTWPLPAGNHSLMWIWVTLNADKAIARRDSAEILDITVWGSTVGGAPSCVPIPPGTAPDAATLTWKACPPGEYSEGSGLPCVKCPANTFNPRPKGTHSSCLPCGPGTSSLPGSTACTVGDITVPSSFCTFQVVSDLDPPSSSSTSEANANTTTNTTATTSTPSPSIPSASSPIVYDLSPLSRVHPGRMFGPIFEDPTAADRQHGPLYFVSVCAAPAGNTERGEREGKSTEVGQGAEGGGGGEGKEGKKEKGRAMECTDAEGKPIATMACRVNPQVMLDEQHRGSHSLGDRVSLFPLSPLSHPPNATDPLPHRPDPILARRGLVMVLEGERCPFSVQGGGGEGSRWGMGEDAEKGKGKGKGEGGEEKYGRLTITFICDPNAGIGHPSPWTEEGTRAAFNVSLPFPVPSHHYSCATHSPHSLLPSSSQASATPPPGQKKARGQHSTRIGHPSPWTEEGRWAAFNASLPFPAWTKRGGDPVPATQGGDGVVPGCVYELAWYSAYVCPLCSEEDVEQVPVADCHNNKRATYKYRHPRVSGGLVPGCAYELAWYSAYVCPLCSEEDVEEVPVADRHNNKRSTFKYRHPRAPLPPDQLCSPCTADDYSSFQQSCTDSAGNHNLVAEEVQLEAELAAMAEEADQEREDMLFNRDRSYPS
ncbi:unnamed protein product, partial [Closterium sp. Naga37s-1]